MRNMTAATTGYDTWLNQVKDALSSINMKLEDWQQVWSFDFKREFDSGTTPDAAAMKANQFWWFKQNKSIGQECRRTPNCWLPQNHQGECQPIVEA